MKRLSGLLLRLEALALAGATLWLVSVTAGSDTMTAALTALREEAAMGVLRWELGDFRPRSGLSPAAALALAQSPVLLVRKWLSLTS